MKKKSLIILTLLGFSLVALIPVSTDGCTIFVPNNQERPEKYQELRLVNFDGDELDSIQITEKHLPDPCYPNIPAGHLYPQSGGTDRGFALFHPSAYSFSSFGYRNIPEDVFVDFYTIENSEIISRKTTSLEREVIDLPINGFLKIQGRNAVSIDDGSYLSFLQNQFNITHFDLKDQSSVRYSIPYLTLTGNSEYRIDRYIDVARLNDTYSLVLASVYTEFSNSMNTETLLFSIDHSINQVNAFIVENATKLHTQSDDPEILYTVSDGEKDRLNQLDLRNGDIVPYYNTTSGSDKIIQVYKLSDTTYIQQDDQTLIKYANNQIVVQKPVEGLVSLTPSYMVLSYTIYVEREVSGFTPIIFLTILFMISIVVFAKFCSVSMK